MPIAVVNTAHFNQSGITHGRQILADGSNTGIAGAGLTSGDLTVSGGGTYVVNGTTVTDTWFTSGVVLEGDDITFRNCLFSYAGDANELVVEMIGDRGLLENCTILPTGGTSFYKGVQIGTEASPADCVVRACDISRCENLLVLQGADDIVEECFLHTVDATSNPASPHLDGIELFSGSDHIIRRNRIGGVNDPDENGAINLSPFFGAISVDGMDVLDNYIDGGNAHILIDVQSTGTVTNVRVLRNDMGGHTENGVTPYVAFQDNDGRGTVETAAAQALDTEAVLWPTSGPDANTWVDCDDLTPDRTGELVTQV